MEMEPMEAFKEMFLCPPVTDVNRTGSGPPGSLMRNFTDIDDTDADALLESALGLALGGENVTCMPFERVHYRDNFKKVSEKLNLYLTPVIIIIGVSGNFLSFLVFTMTHLRRQSSSIYLASLAMVDIGFLLSLSVLWLSWMNIPFFHQNILCQAVVYNTYVCTFLSIWLVVSFTVERYIIVWYPLRKDRLCTRTRARIVVISLTIFAFAVYSFATWTSGIIHIHSMPLCMPFPRYYNFITAMTALDSCLTLVIPSIVVIILNIRITIKINRVQKQRQQLMRHVNYTVTTRSVTEPKREKRFSLQESFSSSRPVHVRFHNPSHSSGERKSSESDSNSKRKCQTRVQVKSNTQYRTARMLIVVSSVFVILILPSHVFRIHAFIQSSLHNDFKSSRKDLSWHEIFQLVYHFNFALNFFIYSVCGSQFRTGLRILYSRLTHKTRRLKHFILVKSDARGGNGV